jgi:hypothetical protein
MLICFLDFLKNQRVLYSYIDDTSNRIGSAESKKSIPAIPNTMVKNSTQDAPKKLSIFDILDKVPTSKEVPNIKSKMKESSDSLSSLAILSDTDEDEIKPKVKMTVVRKKTPDRVSVVKPTEPQCQEVRLFS